MVGKFGFSYFFVSESLVLKDGKVVGEERLLTELNERIRDVIVGPDGAIWLATDAVNGKVLKVVPKP